MVSSKSVEEQLKNINFSAKSWGKAEIGELPSILLDDEMIFECVNGTYEGGFALLVATNIRLLLIDKKPLKFLTVEDLRFDMINQIDYSHRLMGARINVSAGNKNLKFTSFNQQRLRKLINHIQHRMAEVKKEFSSASESQQQHLERINQQLQTYLVAQHQQQEELRLKLEQAQQQGQAEPVAPVVSAAIKPAPELADYLYAQSLMQQYQTNHQEAISTPTVAAPAVIGESSLQTSAPTVTSLALQMIPLPAAPSLPVPASPASAPSSTIDESLVEAGRREIFGAKARAVVKPLQAPFSHFSLEINPLKVAYAKLPTVLHLRKIGAMPAVPSLSSTATILPRQGPHIAGA